MWRSEKNLRESVFPFHRGKGEFKFKSSRLAEHALTCWANSLCPMCSYILFAYLLWELCLFSQWLLGWLAIDMVDSVNKTPQKGEGFRRLFWVVGARASLGSAEASTLSCICEFVYPFHPLINCLIDFCGFPRHLSSYKEDILNANYGQLCEVNDSKYYRFGRHFVFHSFLLLLPFKIIL